MKYILFLLSALLFTGSFTLAQSNYSRGFSVGYINGYRFDVQEKCRVAIPAVRGNAGKFRAGYADGFERALRDRPDLDHKKYYKEFLDVMEGIKSLYLTTADMDALTKAMERTQYYYLNGDYEKSITLIELLARNTDNDYRLNMYKGLSLIELEEFRPGRNFLKWAVGGTTDAPLRERLGAIIDRINDGSFKANKLKDEAALVNAVNNNADPSTFLNAKKTEQREPPPATVSQAAPADGHSKKSFDSGNAKYQKGDFAGAVADFTTAIHSEPLLQSYYMRALAKEKLHDLYGAANDYKFIVSASQKNDFEKLGEVYINYAVILIGQEKFSEAVLQLDKIIAANDKEKMPVALYYRGVAKINLGEKEAGCTDLSRSGELGYADAYEQIKKSCQ